MVPQDSAWQPDAPSPSIPAELIAQARALDHDNKGGPQWGEMRALVRDIAALPDAPPSAVDNPDADATDAAHPAWWRGHDQGVWSTCELLTKTLDGVAGGVCREPLETVRRRIAALTRCAAARSGDGGGDHQDY